MNLLTLDAFLKLLPTIATVLTLIFTLEHCSHPLALPGVLLVCNPLCVCLCEWGGGVRSKIPKSCV